MKQGDQIKVCTNHEEYLVPLIWTFRFHGAEYWCPYCGYQSGMFGAGTIVSASEDLKQRHDLFFKKATPFLAGDTNDWEYKVKADK